MVRVSFNFIIYDCENYCQNNFAITVKKTFNKTSHLANVLGLLKMKNSEGLFSLFVYESTDKAGKFSYFGKHWKFLTFFKI